MKIIKINNIYICIVLYVIFIAQLTESVKKRTCKINDILLLGFKVFCESEQGLSISCFTNSLILKKAYINCDNGYYNEKNITQQIIHCTDKGKWSEKPMKCIPECAEFPKSLELIDDNNLTFPTSYVEIVNRNLSINENSNRFPGLIISESEILTKCKYFENKTATDFVVRIYKSATKFLDHNVQYNSLRNRNKIYQYDELCLLFLIFEEPIRYDEYTKPACKMLKNLPEFSENNFIPSNYDQSYVHIDTKSCIVPHSDNRKVEVTCFSVRQENRLIDCLKEDLVEQVKTRCQIGYVNTKLENKKLDNLLNVCHLNRWTMYGEEKECEQICGKLDNNYTQAFVPLLHRGMKTDILSVPWHVGIYSNNTEISTTYEQICGGSIIHSNIVVSAAHCFYDVAYGILHNSADYLIGAGKRFRGYDKDEISQYYVGIKRIHIPPHYQPQSVQNDLAILILNHHIKFTSYIKPICIDFESFENYDIKEGIVGNIFGWGATSTEKFSNKLLKINLKTVNNSECKKRVHPNFRTEITGDKFCAENQSGATACQGDSGGGFVIKKEIEHQEFRYYLIGVVSVGVDRTKHCTDDSLTMFTNLQFYQDMLKRIIALSRDLDYINPKV